MFIKPFLHRPGIVLLDAKGTALNKTVFLGFMFQWGKKTSKLRGMSDGNICSGERKDSLAGRKSVHKKVLFGQKDEQGHFRQREH